MSFDKSLNQIKGVMLNAYPDSIGYKLSDTVEMLNLPELKDAFSLFYVLPTFFNSDLDRGFSVIDYGINKDLVSQEDIKELNALGIELKFDIVLNHLSVASPQFKDLLKNGEASKYKDFFINWNTFWKAHGEMNEDGLVIPKKAYFEKLFMRKPGLPILNVIFPDGSEQPYWNTFYQKVIYNPITSADLISIEGFPNDKAIVLTEHINKQISTIDTLKELDVLEFEHYKNDIVNILNKNRSYLGQMDVNAKSPLVWEFYETTLKQLKAYGCSILRLDAFAYLHKAIGESNFFNVPGTWDYLSRIKEIADRNQLTLLPEIHAEYGSNLHDAVASRGYHIYDFFFPGLIIHTIENSTNVALLKWANEILANDYHAINMLGCHDGIPVLDLKGKEIDGKFNDGLLDDDEIDSLMDLIIERGGKVKNLYGPDGKKISYYQVNATFFSALGEDSKKMLLARVIQLFMPGIPQVWYLDLFEGKNDYDAVARAGKGGHKEINRTTLSMSEIHSGLKKPSVLKQLELIRLRNTHKAFDGELTIQSKNESEFAFNWKYHDAFAELKVDLKSTIFEVTHS
ncbi:glycosidase [Winogradskyella poriferorum]|uniref:alpha-amylase family glycosyl hydrolase n=1 Tax=Winogradskyella poriferorum TaxID=307627 RepID=UPI003D650DC8